MVANEDAFSSSSSLTRMDVHGTLPCCEAPTMHSPAVEALREANYRPGMKDGTPVKVRMSKPVSFKLP